MTLEALLVALLAIYAGVYALAVLVQPRRPRKARGDGSGRRR